MSRARFAARFNAVVGTPPLHYLARFQLAHAVGQRAGDSVPAVGTMTRLPER